MHVFAVPSLKLILLLFIPYYSKEFFVQIMSFFGSSWRLLTGFYGNHECCKHREEVYQCYDRFHFMISRDWDEHIFYDSRGCRGWCSSTSTGDDDLLYDWELRWTRSRDWAVGDNQLIFEIIAEYQLSVIFSNFEVRMLQKNKYSC
mgnify:CR=1 FL=1